MAGDAQVAADFEQPARRVPAVGLVAVRARGNAHQRAPVEPDRGVGQVPAVTVDRRVALLVALHIDLHVVGFHRHAHAHGARNVDARTVGQPRAHARVDQHLATGCQRERIAFEPDFATARDAHERLIAAMHDVVAHLVRFLDHGVALHVERGGHRLIEQDGRDAARTERHAARGVVLGVEQVDGAARVDRGGRHRHALLSDVVTGKGDVARAGLQQAGVAH
ncbi:hypothetical protein D3C87_1098680 [compost metagenome]